MSQAWGEEMTNSGPGILGVKYILANLTEILSRQLDLLCDIRVKLACGLALALWEKSSASGKGRSLRKVSLNLHPLPCLSAMLF